MDSDVLNAAHGRLGLLRRSARRRALARGFALPREGRAASRCRLPGAAAGGRWFGPAALLGELRGGGERPGAGEDFGEVGKGQIKRLGEFERKLLMGSWTWLIWL